MEEAFNGCRSHGKREKSEDDPIRNAHGSKDPKLSDTKLNEPKFVDPKFSDPNSMTPAHAAKSPTRVPLTDGMPRGTFRSSAAQLPGGGLARAVACSSEFLRGNPLHTACRRNPAPCPVGRCRPARSARNPV